MTDPNHDIVPTLRMFDGVMTGLAADEIERLRKRVAELEADAPAEAREPLTNARIIELADRMLMWGKVGYVDTSREKIIAFVRALGPAIAPADAGEARLTDEQREAIEWAADSASKYARPISGETLMMRRERALRALLNGADHDQ